VPKQEHWVWALIASWFVFCVGLGSALHYDVITDAQQSVLKAIATVVVVGAAPLTWLGLTERFKEVALAVPKHMFRSSRGLLGTMLALNGLGVWLIVTVLTLRNIHFRCQPDELRNQLKVYAGERLLDGACDRPFYLNREEADHLRFKPSDGVLLKDAPRVKDQWARQDVEVDLARKPGWLCVAWRAGPDHRPLRFAGMPEGQILSTHWRWHLCIYRWTGAQIHSALPLELVFDAHGPFRLFSADNAVGKWVGERCTHSLSGPLAPADRALCPGTEMLDADDQLMFVGDLVAPTMSLGGPQPELHEQTEIAVRSSEKDLHAETVECRER
jgi:hypothetical protein